MAVYLRGSCKRKHRHSGQCKTWYYNFMIRRVRYKKAIPEARTQLDAEQAETIERHKVYEGRYGCASGEMDFSKFVNEVYLAWARTNKRSWQDDERTARVLCLFFAAKSFNQISPLLIEKFKRERRETKIKFKKQDDRPRRPASINRELEVLSKIFTLAIDAGVTNTNPCRKVKKLLVNNQRTRYLSVAEEKKLMAQLEGRREHLRAIVIVALYTGLRRGELFNLRKEDVDFDLDVIHVRQSKSGQSRLVPMEPVVRETLLALRDRRSELFFASPATGKRFNTIKTGFTSACSDAEIVNFHFHDLRHTFGTRLADAGVDVVKIKELMGHSTIVTTMRYMHASDEGKRAAVDRLSRFHAPVCSKIVPNEKRQAG